MTQDEIMRMAKESGAIDIGFNEVTFCHEYSMFSNELEAFAKLVAAKEREKVLKEIANAKNNETNS